METTDECMYIIRNRELNMVKFATGAGLVKNFSSFEGFSDFSGPLRKILRVLGLINGLM